MRRHDGSLSISSAGSSERNAQENILMQADTVIAREYLGMEGTARAVVGTRQKIKRLHLEPEGDLRDKKIATERAKMERLNLVQYIALTRDDVNSATNEKRPGLLIKLDDALKDLREMTAA